MVAKIEVGKVEDLVDILVALTLGTPERVLVVGFEEGPLVPLTVGTLEGAGEAAKVGLMVGNLLGIAVGLVVRSEEGALVPLNV